MNYQKKKNNAALFYKFNGVIIENYKYNKRTIILTYEL